MRMFSVLLVCTVIWWVPTASGAGAPAYLGMTFSFQPLKPPQDVGTFLPRFPGAFYYGNLACFIVVKASAPPDQLAGIMAVPRSDAFYMTNGPQKGTFLIVRHPTNWNATGFGGVARVALFSPRRNLVLFKAKLPWATVPPDALRPMQCGNDGLVWFLVCARHDRRKFEMVLWNWKTKKVFARWPVPGASSSGAIFSVT